MDRETNDAEPDLPFLDSPSPVPLAMQIQLSCYRASRAAIFHTSTDTVGGFKPQ
ncbi:hypothetical protein N656DRAFT_783860 [Canariomyces notabilis]|uniref:Uncharacterized protein n=1 Tax=Canariomyces notabilis TaxID=2074819 RepID=A0AAN6QH22_9PEZI|nr:hypothetical protein N656DRAFT_783860 [Canariomyces arenarius]